MRGRGGATGNPGEGGGEGGGRDGVGGRACDGWGIAVGYRFIVLIMGVLLCHGACCMDPRVVLAWDMDLKVVPTWHGNVSCCGESPRALACLQQARVMEWAKRKQEVWRMAEDARRAWGDLDTKALWQALQGEGGMRLVSGAARVGWLWQALPGDWRCASGRVCLMLCKR